jgi:uncharacterized membrane protein YdjX (TVP38/TMEM64 family)
MAFPLAEPAPHSLRSSHSTRLALKLGLGLLLLLLAVGLGRYFGHHLPALERWIADQGAWGFLVFIILLIVGTSLFVPDTIFAVAAGVLFGVAWGSVIVVVGSLLTAALDFTLSRKFLKARVRRWLETHPRFAAVERAARREGLRFLFLLRLTPIHPVTVSYVLGASDTRFPMFLTANLGLIPMLIVEVYFGYAAKHLAKVSGGIGEHSLLHTGVTLAGLLLCVGLVLYVARVARRALAGYETPAPAEIGSAPS